MEHSVPAWWIAREALSGEEDTLELEDWGPWSRGPYATKQEAVADMHAMKKDPRFKFKSYGLFVYHGYRVPPVFTEAVCA